MMKATGAEGASATTPLKDTEPGVRLAVRVLVVYAVLASPFFDRRGESAQLAPVRGEAGTATSSIAALEGEWRRNERISEDPIRKTASLWRDPERASAVLTGLSASLAERVGRLRLQVVDGLIQVRSFLPRSSSAESRRCSTGSGRISAGSRC